MPPQEELFYHYTCLIIFFISRRNQAFSRKLKNRPVLPPSRATFQEAAVAGYDPPRFFSLFWSPFSYIFQTNGDFIEYGAQQQR